MRRSARASSPTLLAMSPISWPAFPSPPLRPPSNCLIAPGGPAEAPPRVVAEARVARRLACEGAAPPPTPLRPSL
eukprot:3935512-Lingulodinium_polyedra.AAC.1